MNCVRRPQPPPEPDPSDCCGEGCVNCVFDVYDTALQRYRLQLLEWNQRGLADEDTGSDSDPPEQ